VATETRRKIVFAPPLPSAVMDLARPLLPAGYDFVVVEPSTPAFVKEMAEAEYYMGFPREHLNRELFAVAKRLRLIQLISAGYDRLDLTAAREARVPIANNGGSNSVAVAEATLMLMLSVAKRLAWQHKNVTAGKWRVGDFSQNRLYELSGKTLGIVGFGTIGKKVARRAKAFDMAVQYYDIVRLTEDQEDALGVRFVLFDELLRTSDVVSLHVPLNAATRNLMGEQQFAAMKPTAFFINTCRGPVVDEDALFKALATGQITAAGLDVMMEEPPIKDHRLFGLENITITPHTAGPTWENWTKAFRNAFDNIQRVASGQLPLWVVPELRTLLA
jgi:phosphoglycerate dehydrogenase-like enzyme